MTQHPVFLLVSQILFIIGTAISVAGGILTTIAFFRYFAKHSTEDWKKTIFPIPYYDKKERKIYIIGVLLIILGLLVVGVSDLLPSGYPTPEELLQQSRRYHEVGRAINQ